MLKNSAQLGPNTIDVGEAHSYIVSVDNTWNNVDDQTLAHTQHIYKRNFVILCEGQQVVEAGIKSNPTKSEDRQIRCGDNTKTSLLISVKTVKLTDTP